MHGVARCVICHLLTSDWTMVGRWMNGSVYACDEHVKEARARVGNLKRSDAAMGNRNAAKRSGNPAVRAGVTPTENGENTHE